MTMKYLRRILCVVFVTVLTVYIVIIVKNNAVYRDGEQASKLLDVSASQIPKAENSIQLAIAVVVCGDRWQETLVMIKSALILTSHPIAFYIFADIDLISLFQEKLTDWQTTSNKTFTFKVQAVTFPVGEFQSEWRKLFKPCASQRLFLPSLLYSLDSVLYVDTDTLFLGPVEQVWQHFSAMNSSQFAALAPEHEDPNTGWYNRFARHPFYGPLGVNTGVMLMNLTRMRSFGWERYVIPIYKKYKLKIPWGDQDIINIIFHFHPDKLYIYSCKYNYRADHCMYMSVCKEGVKEGIVVLHGSRGIFHSEKHPPFRSVYRAMEEYQWGGDLYTELYQPLELYINSSAALSHCQAVSQAFLINIRKYITKPNVRW